MHTGKFDLGNHSNETFSEVTRGYIKLPFKVTEDTSNAPGAYTHLANPLNIGTN